MAGRHRRVQNSGARNAAIGAVPIALAVVCAGTASADPAAVPANPGLSQTEQPVQPASVPPEKDKPRQPGVTTEPERPSDPMVVQSENDPGLQRAEPARPQPLQVPQGAADVPPDLPVLDLAPPVEQPHELRVAGFAAPVPQEVPADLLADVNDGIAQVETQFAAATQFDQRRMNNVATGALIGAAATGIPGAVVGGVGGGLIGAGVGFGVGVVGTAAGGAIAAAAAAVPTGGAGAVPALGAALLAGVPVAGASTVIGAGIGAAVGAAAVGLPAAAVGGVVGGAVGSLV
ncbi:hypothetical protein [Nocardia arizonensis]|uniref:hypothetical protein n=1 Tax=Nocardia arizonensis TaxID=1141647 RepID=UPI000B13EF41|nr:hypothetical protein [Nocardia arizonensis]